MEKLLKYLKIMIKIFEIAAEWNHGLGTYSATNPLSIYKLLIDQKKTLDNK